MSSKSKLWMLVLVAILWSHTASLAQERPIQKISLDDVIERTIADNLELKVSQYALQAAESDVDNTMSFYKPQIHANMKAGITNLPINVFGSRLQQGAIEQSHFAPSSLNSPSAITNLQTQLTIQQPIFNLDIKDIKEATILKSKSHKEQIQHTANTLRYHAIQAYLQLQLTYEAEKILLHAMKTAKANLKLVEDNIEAGYLQKADLLSVQLRINQIENQLFEVRGSIQNASDQISFLMDADMTVQYFPLDNLVKDETGALIAAFEASQRSDIRAMKYQVEAQSHMLQSTKNANMPRINAFGSYELNNPMDLTDGQHGYVLMLQASWKLYDGKKNNNAVQKAKINLEKHQTSLNQMIAQSKLEYQQSKRAIYNAINKIKLTEKAIEQSEEYLRIKTNRFEEGLEKTTDLMNAETDLAQKGMDYIEAVYQYQQAHANLEYLLEEN